jgi:hypothetical protein
MASKAMPALLVITTAFVDIVVVVRYDMKERRDGDEVMPESESEVREEEEDEDFVVNIVVIVVVARLGFVFVVCITEKA